VRFYRRSFINQEFHMRTPLFLLLAGLIASGAVGAQSLGTNGATYPTEPGAAAESHVKTAKMKHTKKVANTAKRSTSTMGSSQAGTKERE
jgi:hypothetical protein